MTDGAAQGDDPARGSSAAGAFDATVYADTGDTATNPARLAVLPARLGGKGSRPLELSLAAGGGAVLHLQPVGGR